MHSDFRHYSALLEGKLLTLLAVVFFLAVMEEVEKIPEEEEREMMGVALSKPAKGHITRKEEHTTKVVV